MGTIIVQGNLKQLLESLNRFKAVLMNREAYGWRVLQHDEDWVCATARDDVVCPLCRGFDGNVYRGDYVLNVFSYGTFISATVIKANTHQPNDPHCRCTLEWVDAEAKIAERIHDELMGAALSG